MEEIQLIKVNEGQGIGKNKAIQEEMTNIENKQRST